MSGSTAIVGSFGVSTNTGAAYLFERGFDGVFDGTTANMWRLSKVLVAPDAATNSYFGFSVALDGSYALVTSLKENAGKGYLFARNYGGLNNWGYLKALEQPSTGTGALLYTGNAGAVHSVNYWSDGQGTTARSDGAQLLHDTPYYGDYTVSSSAASANFGASAVIAGNVMAIGAPFADITNNDVGAVSLWHIHPTWRQTPLRSLEQTLSGGDVAGGDKYGASVHVTSDNRYAVVGAPNARVSQKIDSGAAYLLARSANMAFDQYLKLVPDDPADFDYFGEFCSFCHVLCTHDTHAGIHHRNFGQLRGSAAQRRRGICTCRDPRRSAREEQCELSRFSDASSGKSDAAGQWSRLCLHAIAKLCVHYPCCRHYICRSHLNIR